MVRNRTREESLSSAAFPCAPRWRSNAMCWEEAVGLDVGANTSTIAVSSPCRQTGPVQEGCSVGRPGWPMDAPAAADQLPWLSTHAAIWLMRKRGCARSHMRDLGRYVGAFQIAGFGPWLVQRRALLFVSRACCRHQLTCALMDARGRGAGRRVEIRRQGGRAAG